MPLPCSVFRVPTLMTSLLTSSLFSDAFLVPCSVFVSGGSIPLFLCQSSGNTPCIPIKFAILLPPGKYQLLPCSFCRVHNFVTCSVFRVYWQVLKFDKQIVD